MMFVIQVTTHNAQRIITATKIDPNLIICHESNEALILYYKVGAKSHSKKVLVD